MGNNLSDQSMNDRDRYNHRPCLHPDYYRYNLHPDYCRLVPPIIYLNDPLHKMESIMQLPEGDGQMTEDEVKQCIICMEREKDIAILDCGHICLCAPCFRAFVKDTNPICPICRTMIQKGGMRVFS